MIIVYFGYASSWRGRECPFDGIGSIREANLARDSVGNCFLNEKASYWLKYIFPDFIQRPGIIGQADTCPGPNEEFTAGFRVILCQNFVRKQKTTKAQNQVHHQDTRVSNLYKAHVGVVVVIGFISLAF